MDDFLMPNEMEIQQMAREYAALEQKRSVPFFDKKFSYPMPVFATGKIMQIYKLYAKLEGMVDKLLDKNYGKKNKTVVETIKYIRTKCCTEIVKHLNTPVEREHHECEMDDIKELMYNILMESANLISMLYMLKEQVGGNLLEPVISDELVASSLLHSICL